MLAAEQNVINCTKFEHHLIGKNVCLIIVGNGIYVSV